MIEKIEYREFTITDDDGTETKVIGQVTTIDHEEVDSDGNPKISVKINVPPINLGATPGKVE